MESLLTASDVAKLLNVSLSKAYAIKDEIGYIAAGGNVRFEMQAVKAYVERCRRLPVATISEKRAPASVDQPKGVSADDVSALLREKARQRKQQGHARSNG